MPHKFRRRIMALLSASAESTRCRNAVLGLRLRVESEVEPALTIGDSESLLYNYDHPPPCSMRVGWAPEPILDDGCLDDTGTSARRPLSPEAPVLP